MAVFTKLTENQIKEFVQKYNIGELSKFEEIIEGVENTNYKITCNNVRYILTIFEKRVNTKELPFFVNLKNFLISKKFCCPMPIKSKDNEIINSLNNKKAIIISFLEGNKIIYPNRDHCIEIGKNAGILHNLTINFNEKRLNSLGLEEWKKIYNKCIEANISEFKNIFLNLAIELKYLEENWPKNLPSGIIHADLFRDNVFFIDNKISGIIDFYFSCNNFFIYDLAIIINDWCFSSESVNLNEKFFKAVLNGYESVRKLKSIEYDYLNMMLRAAAVRILITRLHDYIFEPDDAILIKKDPNEYYKILQWHQNNQVIK